MNRPMNRPNFRPVAAPLDVDDEALEKLNDTLRMPAMVKSAAGSPAIAHQPLQDESKEEPRPSPTRKSPTVKKSAPASVSVEPAIRLSVMVPAYLSDAVNLRAAQERSTVRHVVMQALAGFGFEVDPADLIPDGRRPAPRRSRT
jgi:hypothetical protein